MESVKMSRLPPGAFQFGLWDVDGGENIELGPDVSYIHTTGHASVKVDTEHAMARLCLSLMKLSPNSGARVWLTMPGQYAVQVSPY